MMMPCRRFRKSIAFAAAIFACTLAMTPCAQGQASKEPLSKDEVISLLKGYVSPKRVAKLARERGVDFELTPETERELRQAGASQEAIEAIRRAGPLSPASGRPKSVPVVSYAGKPQVYTLSGHEGRVLSLAFSPDSKVLATAAGNSVRLWDTSTGTLLRAVEIDKPKSGRVHSLFLGFSRDSGTLEAAWYGERVGGLLWDVRTGEVVGGFEAPAQAQPRAYGVLSPDGKMVASGNVTGTVHLEDSKTGELIRTLRGDIDVGYEPAFSSDGKTLACGGSDGIQLWDTETWAVLRTLRNTGSVYYLKFSPNGKALAGWTGGDSVSMWEIESGSLLQRLEGHPGGVGPYVFSPDGTVLATAGTQDRAVKLWRWR